MEFMEKIQLNLFLFIAILFNIAISSENKCVLKRYNNNEMKSKMKCKTVLSGYNICIDRNKIYSFNSLLTKILYEYNFSSLIEITDTHLLGRVAIEELKVDNIKNNIIICFIQPSYLFVLSYKGEFIFKDEINGQFQTDNYFKFILFNFDSSTMEYNYILLYSQGFLLHFYQYSINIIKKSNKFKNNNKYQGGSGADTSCELLLDNSQKKVLICFIIIDSGGKKFSAISFLPEENFKVASTTIFPFDDSFLNDMKLKITYSYDKKKILICFIGDNASNIAVYNITDNSLSDFILTIENCQNNYILLNLYYFDIPEEFVFSCVVKDNNELKIFPITKDYGYKENNKFENYEIEGCKDFSIYSILFIKPLNIYNTLLFNLCYDNYDYPARIYLLIENDSNCNNTIKNILQLNDTYSEESNNDEESPEIFETSLNKATYHITEMISTQNEIIQSSIPNKKTDYYQTNEISKNILSNSIIPITQYIETKKELESNGISETHNFIETYRIEESNKVIESSKLEETNYIIKSTQIKESNQINESSQIIETDKQSDKLNNITESDKFTEESRQIIESSQNFGTQSIKSTETVIIGSSQVEILNNFSDYSQIQQNNLTIEATQLKENTQIILSNEITESSDKIKSEELTVKVTNENDSIKINELTHVIYSNEIIESNKLSESKIIIDTTKTEFAHIKVTNEINEITNNLKTERVDNTQICEEQCSKCNEISNSKNLCIECNEKKKYFQIIISSNNGNGLSNEEFKECIKEESKPKNYYFNKTERAFKPCYYTCETCLSNGDSNDHNCITCAKNYIFNIYKNNNCIIGCKYYYYFTNYREYKCTIDNQCPEEASILIPELSKCTSNCMDEEKYPYQYNGHCLNKCPSDTEPNENNICQIKSIEKCTYKLLDLFLDNEIEKSNIEKLAKNYAKEFSYTNNHIINYMSDEYSIILYKTSECITKLRINIPKIDFKDCYQKVKDHYSLQKDLVIAIIDRYIYNEDTGVKNPDTTYAFFHPETGENLNASEICKEVKIIVEENILSIIEDNKTVLFFSNQNVDIFNISNEFYTDICFHFESPNKRDVVIKDRIQTYYPNITLCDSGCKNKGINLTSLTAICECSFKDLLDNNFLNDNIIFDNIIINELIDQIAQTLNILNLEVMKCYKTIFDPKYISKCTGFYLVLIIIFFELICITSYFLFGKSKFIGFIFKVSEIYKDLNVFKNKQNLDITQTAIKAPPKKNRKKLNEAALLNMENMTSQSHHSNRFQQKNLLRKHQTNKIVHKKHKKKRKTMKNLNISINMTKLNINNIPPSNNSNSILLMNSNYMNKNHENEEIPKIYKNRRRTKSSKNIISYKDSEETKVKYIENSIKKGFNLETYLITPFDDMDFEDAVFEEKPSFIIYFFERIKKQHIFVNSFFIVDNIQPRSIKILLFLTAIDLYFLINAMLFNEDYISEIFHIEEQESFFNFIPRSINRYIYTTFSDSIVRYLIKMFFIKEKKYIKLLKRSENVGQLNNEIYLFYKKIQKRYNYFIIITISIALFSWYYISCFNNVYHYTENEWIISSLLFMIITLMFNALSAFLETVFRYLSFKCENDQIYKFSLYFRMFE